MASDSAEYFLRLFLRSQRIYQDLTLATEYSTSEKTEFYQGFAVREWVDIDIGMEFRAFVCNNRFTQMCQYDYLVQGEMLLQDNSREQLKDQLIKFWEQQVCAACMLVCLLDIPATFARIYSIFATGALHTFG